VVLDDRQRLEGFAEATLSAMMQPPKRSSLSSAPTTPSR